MLFNLKKYTFLLIFVFFGLCYSQETEPLTENETQISITRNLAFESDSVERFIVYRGFIVQYNYEKKAPNYTIHVIKADELTSFDVAARRRSNFFVDDNILGNQSALNADYRGSGFDRGHMVPAGDFSWNQLLKFETFVLTNIIPQSPNLNRGIWRGLEDLIRNLTTSMDTRTVIITGAIYAEENGLIGRNSVGIPVFCYKSIFLSESNQMFSFIFPNNHTVQYEDLSNYQTSVDQLELITGEDFYDVLPDSLENIIESEIILVDSIY